nr:integrase domain-containing protein [Thioalkalivibrio sp. XN279]
MDHAVIESLIEALTVEGLSRVAAGVGLARYGGLRREEFCLANLDRWLSEAPSGSIRVVDGTKGGIVPRRQIPLTERLQLAIDFAISVRPMGSCNLLDPAERYKHFKLGEVQRARKVLKEFGIDGYHELRAAYACDRYEQISGFPAPVMAGGQRTAGKDADREARMRVSIELGHRRPSITTAYYGGRREQLCPRFIGGRCA